MRGHSSWKSEALTIITLSLKEEVYIVIVNYIDIR